MDASLHWPNDLKQLALTMRMVAFFYRHVSEKMHTHKKNDNQQQSRIFTFLVGQSMNQRTDEVYVMLLQIHQPFLRLGIYGHKINTVGIK